MFWDLESIWVFFPEKLTSADNIQRHPLQLTISHKILYSALGYINILLTLCSLSFVQMHLLVVPWDSSVQHLLILWNCCSNHQTMLYRWPRNRCSYINLFLVTQCRYCADEDSSSYFGKGFLAAVQHTCSPTTIKMYNSSGLFKQQCLWCCSLE